jgi:death-on-curing protein
MANSESSSQSENTQLALKGEPQWVSRAVVDAIHADLIQQHGGSHGIRDITLLESALDRPKNRYHYEEDADLAMLAASYAVEIAKTHAFIDGNKRTAFQVMYVFLGLNGYRVVATETAVVSLMIDVATGTIDETGLAQWCRVNVVPRLS